MYTNHFVLMLFHCLTALRVLFPTSEVTDELFMHQFKPGKNRIQSDQARQNSYSISIKVNLYRISKNGLFLCSDLEYVLFQHCVH